MKNLTTLIAAAALAGAMTTTAFAGSPAPTPVEADVFVANPTPGMNPVLVGAIALGAVAIIAALADDDESTTTTPE